MKNPISKADAIRDMHREGLDTSRICSMDVQDIVDPVIEYGFTVHQATFLDMRRRECNALGALVLGIGREKEFASRSDRKLLPALSADYCVTVTFLEGVEAGFAQWKNSLSLPCYVGNREFLKGYVVGHEAWRNLNRPRIEP